VAPAAAYPATGQTRCYDSNGREIPCAGSGQDGERRAGRPWPRPRFEGRGEQVLDRLTGLIWLADANAAEFPLDWEEALAFVRGLNRAGRAGARDWRLPNRRELRSLVSHQTRRPALPEDHPFRNVFPGWYWSATTYAGSPAHAWYVHMDGARMFYGGKDQSFFVWPVRGQGNGLLPRTGQARCYDGHGDQVPCAGSGQDGELRSGRPWPRPRFVAGDGAVLDRLTGLAWHPDTDLAGGPTDWAGALAAVAALNGGSAGPWRLPNIVELETLVHCDCHRPALPPEAPLPNPREAYWSATTSAFEPDWAWVLYLDPGAVGVGQKGGAYFHAWAVRDGLPRRGP